MYAMLSALLAGVNAVLSKRCSDRMNTVMLSVIRTVVILAVATVAVWRLDGWRSISAIGWDGIAAIAGAGAATAVAWISYFRALSMGDVNRVSAVDKLSIVLSTIGGWLFLDERMGAAKLSSIGLICVGVGLMAKDESNAVDKHDQERKQGRFGWAGWAMVSVLLISASALLSKVGTNSVAPELVLLLRTTVVLTITIACLIGSGREKSIRAIDKRVLVTAVVSGVVTGVGWLFYFRALANAEASAVHAVDKLSVWVTMILSRVMFRSRFSSAELWGVTFVVAGILILFFHSAVSSQ